jgi:hypothetical protein
MTKTRLANFILLAISAVGGYLVSEQIISQEQLTEVQGIVGMALLGGGFSLFTLISLIKLFPKQIGAWVIKSAGEEKVLETFDTVKKLRTDFNTLADKIISLEQILLAERQARNELGAYDGVSQETKDKLNV